MIFYPSAQAATKDHDFQLTLPPHSQVLVVNYLLRRVFAALE